MSIHNANDNLSQKSKLVSLKLNENTCEWLITESTD